MCRRPLSESTLRSPRICRTRLIPADGGNASARNGCGAAERGGWFLKSASALAVAGRDLHRRALRGLFRALQLLLALLGLADAPARGCLVLGRKFKTPLAAGFGARLSRRARLFLDRLFLAAHRDGARPGPGRPLHGDLFRFLELVL